MTQEAELSIKSDGSHSVVRWSVSGQRGFIGRVMCVFINIDKMVGESFEKGLAKLKSIIENSK